MFPPDDEAKSLDAEERKCEDIKEDNTAAQAKIEEAEERKTNDFKEDNTAAQAKSSDDEEDNIVAFMCFLRHLLEVLIGRAALCSSLLIILPLLDTSMFLKPDWMTHLRIRDCSRVGDPHDCTRWSITRKRVVHRFP